MLDLLAAIVSADPPALLAWLILAFAASGYPLGIMLGSSCSPCCNPCTQCTEGQLPDTLTVTFDGLTDQTPGPDLCLLTFSAPYGSGAAGKVTAPGGDPATDKGPISAVSLTNGGSGYAKLGRVAPTITASGGSGTGATFSVSTTSANDANGIPSWSVTGVTWTGTTSGYVDGDQITFNVATGDTVEQGAAATIRTVRTAPTVTASASGGTGATFGVTIAANGTTPQTWSVTGVTVTNGGTGYPSSGLLTFSAASGDTAGMDASYFFYTGRTAPTLSATAVGFGSGASLSASLASATGWNGQTYWYVDGISITNGGSGYAEFDPVNVMVTDGDGYGAYAEVTSVDGSGSITGIAVYWGGEYFKGNGIIEAVEVNPWGGGGGTYYRDAGEIASISLEHGGIYYREDADEPPYVATVTVGVSQTPPSNGTGATLTATVEDDTASANFGKITGVTIDNGGTDYLAWQWRNTKCCGDYWNGQSVVLKRDTAAQGFWYDGGCTYTHRMCGGANMVGNAGAVYLKYRGPNTPPIIGLLTEFGNSSDSFSYSRTCNLFFTANSNVTNCSEWSGVQFSQTSSAASGELVFVHTGAGSATATVSAGGEYDQLFRNPGGLSCFVCCKGEEEVPAEESVELSDNRANKGDHDFSGTYVLGARIVNPLFGDYRRPQILRELVVYQVPGSSINYTLSVAITPCSHQSVGGGDFLPDQWGCDSCHKKCKMFAILFQNFGGGTPWFSDEGIDCGTCEETPICSIGGKTFALRLGGDASGAEDFTLTT